MEVVLHGEGHYTLSSIKDIEVTEEFVGLGPLVTNCQTEEDRVDCLARRFREKVISSCRCSPYTLTSYFGHKVRETIIKISILKTLQLPLCSPSELDCVEGEDGGEECLQLCEGTIVDVERITSSVKNEKSIARLIEDYENYKDPDSSNISYPDAMKGEIY